MKRIIILIVLAATLLAACAGAGAPAPATSIPATDTAVPTKTVVPTETPAPVEAPTAEPTQAGPIPVDLPPAQVKAVEALATQLGIDPGVIKVVKVEAVDWPDKCLGVQRMGVMCAQGVTPGFRIILEADGQQYEFHTNQDGSVVVQSALGDVNGESAGVKTAIDMLSTALGFPADQIKVVANASVEWPDGCLGVTIPGVMCAQMVTPGRSIVLEANGVQYEYHTNQDGSVVVPASLALTWHREGGVAGFCDDLSIFLPNTAYGSSCKAQAGNSQQGKPVPLTTEEMTQLQTWLAQYGAVTVTMKDSAAADAMTQNLMLQGRGSDQPTKAEQQAMLDWAQGVYTRIQQPQS